MLQLLVDAMATRRTGNRGIAWARTYFNWFGWLLRFPNALDRLAYRELVRSGRLAAGQRIVELGAGNGYFASMYLAASSPSARATLVEVSDYCIRRLRRRFHEAGNVDVVQALAPPPLPVPAESCDRFIACFVLELMSRADRQRYLEEARRVLAKGGLLCVMHVTGGGTLLSRAVMAVASFVARISPWLVLGARFCDVGADIGPEWRRIESKVVVSGGCATRLLVAERVA